MIGLKFLSPARFIYFGTRGALPPLVCVCGRKVGAVSAQLMCVGGLVRLPLAGTSDKEMYIEPSTCSAQIIVPVCQDYSGARAFLSGCGTLQDSYTPKLNGGLFNAA
jgi:hypothetical protein